jgi:hypothetical protein
MSQPAPEPPPAVVTESDLIPTQAIAGWEAIRFSVDHVLVRDLQKAQHLVEQARHVLARGK